MHKYAAAIVADIVVLPLYLLDVIDLVGVVLAFLLIEGILYLSTFIRTIKQIVA